MAKAALRKPPHRHPQLAGLMRREAADLLDRLGETIFTGVNRQTNWIAHPQMQLFLSGRSTVDFNQLKHGGLSIYLILPDDFEDYRHFLRLFIMLAQRVMLRKMPDGAELGTRCLFILDGLAALGDIGLYGAWLWPSSGLHVWPFCRCWQELTDTYGEEGAESFLASCDAFSVYGLDDEVTPQIVSNLISGAIPADAALRRLASRVSPDRILAETAVDGSAKVANRILVRLRGDKWVWLRPAESRSA